MKIFKKIVAIVTVMMMLLVSTACNKPSPNESVLSYEEHEGIIANEELIEEETVSETDVTDNSSVNSMIPSSKPEKQTSSKETSNISNANVTTNSTAQSTVTNSKNENSEVSSNDNTSSEAISSVTSSNVSKETQTSTGPHKHTYTSTVTLPTCTENGYTTYTCECGHSYKYNYVEKKHNYENYVCTLCGAIDKSQAYEYLIEWVKANGSQKGTHITMTEETDDYKYDLVYATDYKFIFTSMYNSSGESTSLTVVYLDDFYYISTYKYKTESAKMEGYFDPAIYRIGDELPHSVFEASIISEESMADLSNTAVATSLVWLREFLKKNNVGITLNDLGLFGC